MVLLFDAPGSKTRGEVLKTTELPSADQLGSPGQGSMSLRLPPSTETAYIVQALPVEMPWKAMRFPSGDQRGKKATIGENLSLSFSVPSNLLRHNVPSGTVTYATHCPSLEKSTV